LTRKLSSLCVFRAPLTISNKHNYYIGNEAIIYNGRGVINETNDFITLQYMMVILIYIKQSKIQH
jgi:hypothetical protein